MKIFTFEEWDFFRLNLDVAAKCVAQSKLMEIVDTRLIGERIVDIAEGMTFRQIELRDRQLIGIMKAASEQNNSPSQGGA